MKMKLFTIGMVLASASVALADFSPITLTPSTYTHDIVVEKTASAPVIPGGYTTASMDGGTNNNGDTWNEAGYFADNPTVGLPVAGSTFTSVSASDHSYKLASDYRANDAVMLDASTTFARATLTVNSPTAYGALSFLTSGGNGGCIFRYTVHHQDGSTESGTSPSADWFNGANPAWIANGRVNAQTFTLDNLNSENPRLYSKDVSLSNVSSPITSIDLEYVSSAAGAHTCIMAVSGAAAVSGAYNPIEVTGYNADIVVEKEATQQHPLTDVVSATMDSGIGLTLFTWYEQGYATNAPNTGLPTAGSTLTSTNAAEHQYVLAPTYGGNNAVLIDADNSSAVLTFQTPKSYAGFSLLGATANGGVTLSYDVHHTDGSIESGTVPIKDWFNNTPAAYTVNGRVNVETALLDNVNNNNPRLYSADFAITDTTTPVDSITLTFLDGGATAHAAILAVSGSSGAVAPVFAVQPLPVKLNPGESATLTGTVSGTEPITYQWQKGTNGVFANIADSAVVSGSTTAQLTLSGVSESDAGDYRLVATNGAGSANSAGATVTVLSQLPRITTPTDAITSIGGTSPSAEGVQHAIDQQTDKYLNSGTGSSSFAGPVGFVVTPSQGRTILEAVRFYTANDVPDRDPIDYKIEGSNDGGSSYSVIASGALALPDDRNNAGAALDPVSQALQQITLTNTASYGVYRVTFNNVKNNSANLFQIGEVEMLGTVDNSGAPYIATQPQPVSVYQGSSAQFTAAASGTPAPTLRWMKRVNGTLTPLNDGGNISGATTDTLTLNNVTAADAGTYVVVASSSSGTATSSPANLTVLSTLQDVTTPGDLITAFGDESGTFWNTSADPANVIDNTTTKYVNGGSGFSASAGFPPFNGPVGVVVTPSVGSTVVQGLRVYTADGNPERDPMDYKLEGSNDGTSFTVISSGSLSLPDQRNASDGSPTEPLTQAMQEVLFSNNAAYTNYRLTFTNVRDASRSSSMQVAEIELLGGPGTSGPSVSVTKETDGSITITSSQPGTLQSTTQINGSATTWTDEGPISGSVTVPATGKMKFFQVVTP
jgi:hypothetical protein